MTASVQQDLSSEGKKMVADMKSVLAPFESLGDNCEFGFLQRYYGLEPGGLLRWAFTPPQALIKMLSSQFGGIYQYDYLVPSEDNMVCDQKSGAFFHTNMKSTKIKEDRIFIHNDAERKTIYDLEFSKINYMKQKLLDKLKSGEAIFVYKKNIGLTANEIDIILDAIIAYHPDNRLFVIIQTDDPDRVGLVEAHDPRRITGFIDKFAPYNKADSLSVDVWSEIVRKAKACASQLSPYSMPTDVSGHD